MENIPRVLEKEIERMTSTRGQVKPPRRWQLLLVGERGRVYTIKHFRMLLALLLLMTTATAAGVVVLYLYYQKPVAENQRLAAEITAARETVERLKEEKELLMARLARTRTLLEDRQPEPESGTPPTSAAAAGEQPTAAPSSDAGSPAGRPPALPSKAPSSTPPAEDAGLAKPQTPLPSEAAEGPESSPPPDVAVTDEDTDSTAAEEEGDADTEPVDAAAAVAPSDSVPTAEAPTPIVAVEELRLIRRAEKGLLGVQFKIRKIAEDVRQVRGYAFVLVGSADLPPDQWLVFPKVRLVDGRPAITKSGRYFAIARFNTIRFSPRSVAATDAFDQATVLVYDKDGSLLLEEKQTP